MKLESSELPFTQPLLNVKRNAGLPPNDYYRSCFYRPVVFNQGSATTFQGFRQKLHKFYFINQIKCCF